MILCVLKNVLLIIFLFKRNKGYFMTSSTKSSNTLDSEQIRLYPEKPILNGRIVPSVLEEVAHKTVEPTVVSGMLSKFLKSLLSFRIDVETLYEALPPFTKLTLDKLYVLGQARALTVSKLRHCLHSVKAVEYI
jgi:hypothetical protein